MIIRKIVLMLSFALFLASCAATPKISLKSGDMAMEVKSKAPIVMSIAYSPDGRYILIGSFDNSARLWDIGEAKLVRTFKHTKRVVGVAFSPDNRYALSMSADDTARLYEISSGREIRRFHGNFLIPDSVAFSPDGKIIAFANMRIPLFGKKEYDIKLYASATGKKIREFKDNESPILFSPDGKYLLTKPNKYVTSPFANDADFNLKLWDISTGEESISFEGASSQFLRAAFSPDGRFLAIVGFTPSFMSCDSFLTFWDISTGLEIKRISHPCSVFEGLDDVTWSPDGRYVLTSGIESGKVSFKLWDPGTGAITKALAEIPTFTFSRGTVFGSSKVVFSPDGRFAILSALDASVRIYDVATGEEAAMFIAFEDGEWLVTTPSGYYNASENGDQYLSVKVGSKEYSISQMRESFYRPDLVKLALSGGSLKEFKKVADIKEPPAVSIVDTPKNVDKGEAVITLKITDTGGGIGDTRLYLNGSAIVLDSGRGVTIVPTQKASDVYKKYTIKVTNGLNTIRAIAFNSDNTMQSDDAIYEITASLKSFARPSLYALVIGINEYKNPKLQLNYAVADAGVFADTLHKGASGLFEKVTVKRLTTQQETTSENIINELKALRNLNPDDLFVFYVASHGTVDDGEYFLITSNVGSTSTTKLKTDAIPQHVLKELIANIPTTKKLIVIDTCSAGKLGDVIQTAMLTRGMSEDTAMKVLSRAVGSTILMATTSVQEALEGYNEHGLFTYVVSEGLKGKADNDNDGFVKTTELANYVDDEVPALAEKIFKKAQYPTVSPSGQAFPIGKVK